MRKTRKKGQGAYPLKQGVALAFYVVLGNVWGSHSLEMLLQLVSRVTFVKFCAPLKYANCNPIEKRWKKHIKI